MDLAKLSQQIFKVKAVLFAICVVIVLIVLLALHERAKALGIALVFMCLSTIGDIVLGYFKNKAGLGFVSSLLVPAIMFVVFLFLAIVMLFNLTRI